MDLRVQKLIILSLGKDIRVARSVFLKPGILAPRRLHILQKPESVSPRIWGLGNIILNHLSPTLSFLSIVIVRQCRGPTWTQGPGMCHMTIGGIFMMMFQLEHRTNVG